MAKLVIGDVIVIKELDRMGRNNDEIKENFVVIFFIFFTFFFFWTTFHIIF